MWPRFKTEMLIYQLQANFVVNILFGKNLDLKTRKILLRCLHKRENFMSDSGP